VDIASIVHGAPERMSPGADIDAMCAVIAQAGKAIFGDRSFDGQDDPVGFRNRNLRHQFMVQRHGLRPVRDAARHVKRALQRLGFSI
jgi:hypothetical protein